ncbi:MAG: hypothetical protein IKZ82_04680 [Clostridia bacterium]|nr:hypothetical protein [Clostridia bacterium]
MENIKAIISRLIVCAAVYTLLEAILPRQGKKKGLFESASKAAAVALCAAVIGV